MKVRIIIKISQIKTIQNEYSSLHFISGGFDSVAYVFSSGITVKINSVGFKVPGEGKLGRITGTKSSTDSQHLSNPLSCVRFESRTSSNI